ncbi:MAG: T9SS type A sorting domain-containing protein [Chryseolinea sp.]
MKRLYILLAMLFFTIPMFAQNPQGFFLDDFEPKSIANPAFVEFAKPTQAGTSTVTVDFTNVVSPVSKYIFGNNANIYMTQMVDQPVLINNIKTLSPNLLRFPGGNISSVYFWNAETKDDLPSDVPEFLLDANGVAGNSYDYWYGGNTGNWTMSLDNYYQMLDMTESTGIITINYAYARYSKAVDPVGAAAHLAAEWVRYDNGRTKFWEIGNESNGTWQAGHRIKVSDNKDGQPEIITGNIYGEHFKVFADSMRKAATEIGATIYVGAQLLQEAPASWWNSTDKNWNSGIFGKTFNSPDYYIIHSYYTPYATNSTAAEILTTATTVTTDMMQYVTNSMTTAGVTVKPVALTEWNIFAEGSKQQVSFVNGMHSALVLGELIKNKYGQASRWDLANGYGGGNDHGMFSRGDEPDNTTLWNPRPVFFYMYYFQKYFGDHMVSSTVTGNSDIVAYASKFESGQSGIVVINKSTTEQIVNVSINHFGFGDRYYVYTLTGGTDNGEFSRKVLVNGKGTALASGGPPNVGSIAARAMNIGSGVSIAAPSRSVNYILVENGENVITANEAEANEHFNVYPNPSNGNIHIDLPSTGFTKVELVDTMGKVVLTQSIEATQLSHEIKTNIPSGLYVLRLTHKTKILSSKIIID